LIDGRRLDRAFFERDAPVVAPELLGAVLVVGEVAGRVTEVEAYTADDPASHSFRGPTRRNATMFGPPGFLYVYFTYGMHWCANVVTGRAGDGQAVLLRAVTPLVGIDVIRHRRAGRADRDLTNGPAKLCQAFGLSGADDGRDLVTDPGLALVDDGSPTSRMLITSRIGIRVGLDRPWRWVVAPPR
jgi:DNA-3-methyladenine glycosylase